MSAINVDNPVLNELRKISKILLLANSAQLDKELEKVADNDTRKKIWVLIDGKRMPKDIAKQVGVSLMTVSRFLDSASAADLVSYTQREPPSKILDYVPASWLSLVFAKEEQVVTQSTDIASARGNEKEEKKGTQATLSGVSEGAEKQ